MGCKIIIRSAVCSDKIKKSYLKLFRISFIFILVSIIIFSFFAFLPIKITVSAYTGFVPNPPMGNTTSDVNVENEYIIISADIGSYWKFDWGDGAFTDWIKVEVGQTYILQSHSWSTYGSYELKVKHKSTYSVESSWSEPLIITVLPSSDVDRDGWANEIEESYLTDCYDSDDFPLDFDKDGTPDDDSPDGKYEGDLDDDNDGLKDYLELSIGTNPKDENDIVFAVIQSTTYCLIDTNNDGIFNYLYNPANSVKNYAEKKGDYYYLDVDNDQNWDYKYSNGYYEAYIDPFEIPWFYIAIGVIIGVIITLFILFKKGVLFVYQEEVIIEEK